MKQALLTAVVFAAAFGAAWWLFRQDAAAVPGGGDWRPAGDSPRAESNDRGAPVGRGGSGGNDGATAVPGAAPNISDDFPAGARREFGVIRAAYQVDPGSVASGAYVTLTPASGRLVRSDFEGFEFVDVPPGIYQANVVAPGFTPRFAPGVEVHAGTVSRLALVLEAGLPVEGVVFDGVTQHPVQGATVVLGGLSMTSDANGRFKAPRLLPSRALETLVVFHPEYDRTESRMVGVQDTTDVRVGLTRGSALIEGRLVLGDGEEPPDHFVVRLFRLIEARRELRRELIIRGSLKFEFRNVTAEPFQVVAEFPGTTRLRRYVDVDVTRETAQQVEIQFGRGTRLEGGYLRNGVAYGPSRVELADEQGRSFGERAIAADGTFRFDHVQPGDYRLLFRARIPELQSELFAVPSGTSFGIDVDFDSGKVFERR